MLKILVSNIAFGEAYPEALNILGKQAEIYLNEKSDRYSEEEFIDLIKDKDILIAGTEKITKPIIQAAKKLKLIARVGSGIDNIDLEAANKKNISICYTPDAPSISIPEFTLALVLNLIKGISFSDRNMHANIWHRTFGRNLSEFVIGIFGCGKIGKELVKLLRTMYKDIKLYFYDPYIESIEGAEKVNFEQLIKLSDIVSIHAPLTKDTQNLFDRTVLFSFKKGTYLINTARGSIVDEEALYEALQQKHLAGAALDVFSVEPYYGALNNLDNCILTSHIGSMNTQVRALMEQQVIEDVMNFIHSKPMLRVLPNFNFV